MTVKEIASVTGKKDGAVRSWVRRLASKNDAIASKNGASTSTHPADYTPEETLEIVREGLGEVPAGVYRAAIGEPGSTQPRLPNGAQLHELRRMVETGVLYPAHVRMLLGLGESYATTKEGASLARGIVEDLRGREARKVEGAASAARRKAQESIERKRERDKHQRRIDFGER